MKKLILILLATMLLSGCAISFDEKKNGIQATEFPSYNIVCFIYTSRTLDCEPLTPQQ